MKSFKHALTVTGLVIVSTFAIGGCGSKDEETAGAPSETPSASTSGGSSTASGAPQAVSQPGVNNVPPGDAPKEKEAVADASAKPKE